MSIHFEGLTRFEADGRKVLHLTSEDVAADAAEIMYLYPLYEVVPGERTLFVLVPETVAGARLAKWE